jgi:predicted ATPase
MTVNRLSPSQVEQLATQVAGGNTLPAAIIQQLVDKTDGVPLYVEEMTKAVLESGVLKEINSHYELTGSIASLSIPATLQDSLMARLDRLVTAKAVAQYASVIGRQFSYEVLQAVSELDEATLQRELGRLVDAELVYQRGVVPSATYIFKHALIQDTAYESLLRSTRQNYHQRIAQALEEQFPETAETQPELLAYHYTEAGMNEQAVVYWQQAGEQGIQRSANVEAIKQLSKGVELLQTLPDTPERVQQELSLLTALGSALIATQGFGSSEVERVYTRSRELCQQGEASVQLVTVLRVLANFYMVRGQIQLGYELAEQCLSLAHRVYQPMLVEAYGIVSDALHFLGAFDAALTAAEHGTAHYTAPPHRIHPALQDPGIYCLGYTAWPLWHLGYPDQAVRKIHEARALAQDLAHPYSQTWLRFPAAVVHALRREFLTVQEHAEALIAGAMEQGFRSLEARGMFMSGWALVMQGQAATGIARIHQSIAVKAATDAVMANSLWFAVLGAAYGTIGKFEEGFHFLAEALAHADKTRERFYEAELHRLKGQLLLQQSSDNSPEAESCFHQAISIAQNQSAKSWELRASTSLARLWQSQGKRDEARELLEPVYSWFTEGFDTADLIDAKALLVERIVNP